MKDEYIIINKTAIQKRIEELEDMKDDPDKLKDPRDWSFVCGQLDILNFLLSKSTPLIPEIEKAWEHGYTRGYNCAFCEINHSDCLTPNKQDYIENLKLDI